MSKMFQGKSVSPSTSLLHCKLLITMKIAVRSNMGFIVLAVNTDMGQAGLTSCNKNGGTVYAKWTKTEAKRGNRKVKA